MDGSHSSAFSVGCGEKCGCRLHLRKLSQESVMVREEGLMMVEGGSVYLSSLLSKACNN